MKTNIRILLLAMVALLCAASFCACDPDWYQGKRPIDQPGTKWVCEEYGMSFEVDENGLVQNGVFNTEDGDIAFGFMWAVGSTHVTGYDANSFRESDGVRDYDTIFDGTCEFGKKEFEIYVKNENNDPNDYFPNSCTLRFVRVEK